MRTIYYYQEDVGLQQAIDYNKNIDEIIISSVHFKKKRMFLNDNYIEHKVNHKLFNQAEELFNKGVRISLMVGGSGGAFKEMFSNFEHYYTIMENFLKTHPYITGVNLDIEEAVDIERVISLISILQIDMGNDFSITLAPLASAMSEDVCGLGGFCYKDLYNAVGAHISFNVQSYGDLSFNSLSADTYQCILDNGYPKEKINLGMQYSDYSTATFYSLISELEKIHQIHPDVGIFVWEYAYAPPDKYYHTVWADNIKSIGVDSSNCMIM